MARVGHEYEDSMGVYPGSGSVEYRAMMQKTSAYDQLVAAQNARVIVESNQAVVTSNDEVIKSNDSLSKRVAILNESIVSSVKTEEELVAVAKCVVQQYAKNNPDASEQIGGWIQESIISKPKVQNKIK